MLVVCLDRPEKRNALDAGMQAQLGAALERAGVDPQVRAVILTGSGDAFCAGADVGRFEEGVWEPARFRRESHRLTRLITAVEILEKPVVAAINGVATGVGTQLALACDLRIASSRARLLYRERRIGLIPSHGGCVRLVKLVGWARARDILLGGEELSAEQAWQLGLVTRVVPAERLMEEARAAALHCLEGAPQAYGLAKRLLWLGAQVDLESGMFAESLAQSLLVGTEDHREGLRAWRERRPPRFEGR